MTFGRTLACRPCCFERSSRGQNKKRGPASYEQVASFSIRRLGALYASAQADGRALSVDMSAQLFAALDPSVFTLDVIGLFDQVNLSPVLFGLPLWINVTGSCLTNGIPPSCDNFAFFDWVHPTTAVQGILADRMISAIPEPGTFLLLGLGLLGLARQRRTVDSFRLRSIKSSPPRFFVTRQPRWPI